MSKVCQVTGRKPAVGNTYVTRGIAKKKKGIGIKITGKTKCRFMPNLVDKKIFFPEEKRFIHLRLSCAAMRTMAKKGVAAIVRQLRAQGHVV